MWGCERLKQILALLALGTNATYLLIINNTVCIYIPKYVVLFPKLIYISLRANSIYVSFGANSVLALELTMLVYI